MGEKHLPAAESGDRQRGRGMKGERARGRGNEERVGGGVEVKGRCRPWALNACSGSNTLPCFTERASQLITCEDGTFSSCSCSSLPCVRTQISGTLLPSPLLPPDFASAEVAFFSLGELGRRNCLGIAQSFLFLLKGDAHPVPVFFAPPSCIPLQAEQLG